MRLGFQSWTSKLIMINFEEQPFFNVRTTMIIVEHVKTRGSKTGKWWLVSYLASKLVVEFFKGRTIILMNTASCPSSAQLSDCQLSASGADRLVTGKSTG